MTAQYFAALVWWAVKLTTASLVVTAFLLLCSMLGVIAYDLMTGKDQQ